MSGRADDMFGREDDMFGREDDMSGREDDMSGREDDMSGRAEESSRSLLPQPQTPDRGLELAKRSSGGGPVSVTWCHGNRMAPVHGWHGLLGGTPRGIAGPWLGASRFGGGWGFVFSAFFAAESRELGISVGVEWPQRTQRSQRAWPVAAIPSGVDGWMGCLVPVVSRRSTTGYLMGLPWDGLRVRTRTPALPGLDARTTWSCTAWLVLVSAASRTDRASGGSTHVGLPRGIDDVPAKNVEEPFLGRSAGSPTTVTA